MTTVRRAALALAGALLLLAGCATKGTQVTDADIQAARAAGTLEALFERVDAELQAEGSRPSEKTVAVRAQIGSLLGAELEEEIEARLATSRGLGRAASLDVIESARAELAPMERWDPARYARVSATLDREADTTRNAIAGIEEKLQALPEDAFQARLEAIAQLVELAGQGTAKAAPYEARRDDLLLGLTRGADEAIRNEQLSDAQELLRMAQEVDPENAEIEGQLAIVDAQLFEQRFWKALEDGRPDGAYQMLREISSDPNFDAVRQRLAPSAAPMADYFVALAAEATGKGQLTDAYRWFSQARSIRELLGADATGPLPEEAPFVDLVKKHYWAARKENRPALAWAYLSVIVRLEDSSPSLRRMIRETRELVLAAAVKRVTAMPFEESGDGPEFGEAVSSKVIQHLFESIPQDIRIIEREQLSDILREQEIGNKKSELASADFIIQGDILEAKVDTNEKQGRKTMRVVTETVTEQNPAYLRWLELDSGDRKKIEQPPAEITRDRKEDVSVDVTLHRKVGIFSVAYRVIDADSAKVIFTDSVREKEQYEDTSTEGVELGSFQMEFKLASLPSDLEILAQLADEISTQIGGRLAEVMAEPEKRYTESGQRYVDEGNFESASESFAYAFVLIERKGDPLEEVGEALRTSAMRTIERPHRPAALRRDPVRDSTQGAAAGSASRAAASSGCRGLMRRASSSRARAVSTSPASSAASPSAIRAPATRCTPSRAWALRGSTRSTSRYFS